MGWNSLKRKPVKKRKQNVQKKQDQKKRGKQQKEKNQRQRKKSKDTKKNSLKTQDPNVRRSSRHVACEKGKESRGKNQYFKIKWGIHERLVATV